MSSLAAARPSVLRAQAASTSLRVGPVHVVPKCQTLVKALNVSTCGLSSSAAIGVVGARRRPLVARATADGVDMSWRNKPANEIRVLVVGSTGYIGRTVVKELVSHGFEVTAVARSKSGVGAKNSEGDVLRDLRGAKVLFGNVADEDELDFALQNKQFDVVVSCLASRTGGIKDSWLIDYRATRNAMMVGQAHGAKHFVLLSAICVQKPLLEFQKAKLKFESDLVANKGMTHSIVRPTAFFKSLAGQIEGLKGGAPYVMFGDGNLAACKPISEADLAAFIADCVLDRDNNLTNKILPIGGPGPALTAREQADMLFQITGMKPKFFPVPVALMDGIITTFDGLSKVFPQLEDSAEFARIGKYYATESMLVMDPETGKYDADATPEYGRTTLRKFFERAVQEGGLEGQELGDQAVF